MSAPRMYVTSHRPAEDQPGGPARPAWLHIGGPWDGDVSVLVEASGTGVAAANAVAEILAASIDENSRALANAEARAERAEETTRKAEASCAALREKLDAVLTGRALFGPALVKVEQDGACWLLDPKKRERGFGLRFESLAELWTTFPQLRPVRWDGGDMIVEGLATSGGRV